MPEYHPTIGDAIGYAMDHNARLAARIASERAAEETHVVTDDSDDPEHIDDCPGCETFSLTGHVAAPGEPAEAQATVRSAE
jgi:hypothetical protein